MTTQHHPYNLHPNEAHSIYVDFMDDDISEHLGVARDVLTRRLTALVDEGILTKSAYQEPGRRTRYEYRLTPAGRDLRPVLLALIAWGDEHRATDGPPMTLTHRDCGAPVRLAMVCEAGPVSPLWPAPLPAPLPHANSVRRTKPPPIRAVRLRRSKLRFMTFLFLVIECSPV